MQIMGRYACKIPATNFSKAAVLMKKVYIAFIKSSTTIRAETMVCFTAFSLKADQMPIFGLLLVFFLLKSLHFMNFPQNDD